MEGYDNACRARSQWGGEIAVITTSSTSHGEFDRYCKSIYANEKVCNVVFNDVYVPNLGIVYIAHFTVLRSSNNYGMR